MSDIFLNDIEAVNRITSLPSMLDVVCRITGMGFAAVARVTATHWVTCATHDTIAFGLKPGDELDVETTICHEIHAHQQPVVINHVSEDPNYCDHHTPRQYGFESYISVPIHMSDGAFFGTLCALDAKPRMLDTPEVVNTFKLFAELIGFHLRANADLTASAASLAGERENSKLREQFIAVLGHDLRSPLSSIQAAARLIRRRPENTEDFLINIERSVSRMAGLIANVVDFARGRLGGGVTANRSTEQSVEATLQQVLDETRATHPDRALNVMFSIGHVVRHDPSRLSQLFANLLNNAVTHGRDGTPIDVRAITSADVFRLTIGNQGERIPQTALENLFQPFFRADVRPSQEGLGLGLYIASEIATAHAGTLTVTSDEAQTIFCFEMPC